MQKKQSSCSANWSPRARQALALAAASTLAQFGCNTTCDTNPDDNPPQVYTAGIGNPATETYESTSNLEPPLPFPGGKQYFLVHHLGFTPATLQIDVGFNNNGDDLAHCAGNTCIHPCVNSELIWIRNDTCADFLVRVVATGRSNSQQGTLCPGDASISVVGATATTDASVEVTPPLPDSSEAQAPTPDAALEAPAE